MYIKLLYTIFQEHSILLVDCMSKKHSTFFGWVIFWISDFQVINARNSEEVCEILEQSFSLKNDNECM